MKKGITNHTDLDAMGRHLLTDEGSEKLLEVMKMKEATKKSIKEKVIWLADDLTSIMTLKDLIDDLRNDRLKNFIVIAQSKAHGETEVTRGIPLEDASSSGKVLKYYFFGDDSNSYHVGLCHRMAYLINRYMEGENIFGEEEDFEED